MDRAEAPGTMHPVDLRTAIASMATVEGPILKVDRFLNHRVEPSLITNVGHQIAALLGPLAPDLLLTAEASGIPPALAAGIEINVPIVYAKKYLGPGGRYTFSREVNSPTKGTEYRVEVAATPTDPPRLIADGSTVQVFYDLEAGRIKRVPIRLLEQLTDYEGRPLPTRPADA